MTAIFKSRNGKVNVQYVVQHSTILNTGKSVNRFFHNTYCLLFQPIDLEICSFKNPKINWRTIWQ